jgi:hypothetical protein
MIARSSSGTAGCFFFTFAEMELSLGKCHQQSPYRPLPCRSSPLGKIPPFCSKCIEAGSQLVCLLM